MSSDFEKADGAIPETLHRRTDLEYATARDTPKGWMSRYDGPTPTGGVCSVAHFLDAQRRPVPQNEAVQFYIMEYDAQGRCISRAYGYMGEWEKDGPPADAQS